jgi:hypothetical protein
MADEYDMQAEKLLPCNCNNRDGREGHFSSCAGYWRGTVADALREAYQTRPGVFTLIMQRDDLRREVERLRASLKEIAGELEATAKIHADLRREVERLQSALDNIRPRDDPRRSG